MIYTSQGLVEYCERMLKMPSVYMWGGLMQIITDDLIAAKRVQYPGQYTTTRLKYLRTLVAKSYGCDCSGLIKSYLFGGIGAPRYDAKLDTNTSGMWLAAQTKGSIRDLPDLPGVILYMPGHVGVYTGDRKAIECTLGEYGDGIVRTKVDGRGWTGWLMHNAIDYELDGNNAGKCTCTCKCDLCPNSYFTYTVQPGDSFRRIAQMFLHDERRYEEICFLNSLAPTHVIHPGDKLKIPTERR